MAATKILARNARLDQAIQYALNGDKTDHRILTAHQNCDPGREFRQMMDTKREIVKLDGRQCYHIIQFFKPGEVTPELALEIAKEFAAEYLTDYEVVIGTHVDKNHIHSHLVFNSVNAQTGEGALNLAPTIAWQLLWRAVRWLSILLMSLIRRLRSRSDRPSWAPASRQSNKIRAPKIVEYFPLFQ